jgi:hypothetical protein
MIQTKHVINSLPLVADVLGRKYGVQVHIGGDTAYTNGKDIFIPSLPLDSDQTTLNLARAYIDHESAHLRETNITVVQDAALSPVEKAIWNILEDVTVESKLTELYPGCSHNLNWLRIYVLLNEKLNEHNDNLLILLLDWIFLYIRAGDIPELKSKIHHSEQILNRIFPGMRQELKAVMDTVPVTCVDTASCIATAREMTKIIRNYEAPEPDSQPESGPEPEDNPKEDGESDSDSSADSPSSASSDSQEQSEQDGNPSLPCPSDKEGQDASEAANADDMGDTDDSDGTEGDSDDGDASDHTDDANDTADGFSDDLDGIDGTVHDSANSGRKDTPADFGGCDQGSDSTADSGADRQSSPEQYSGTRGASPVSSVEKLRELLAQADPALPKDLGDALREALQDVGGKAVDALSVATAVPPRCRAFNEEELAAVRQATNALKTRLQALLQSTVLVRNRSSRVGLVDTGRLARLAVNDPHVFQRRGKRQGVNTAVHILLDSSSSMCGGPMTLACKACYAVASALDAVPGISVAVSAFPTGGGDTVSSILRHKEKMHSRFNVVSGGGTPMAPALWWVMQQLHVLTEERKILLLITDGQPDTLLPVINAVNAALAQGIEVLGIGINTYSIKAFLSQDTYRVIKDLAELAPAMFSMLQNTLLHKKQGGSK